MSVLTDRKAQKSIVTGGTNSTRALYWIKEFINTFLPANSFSGRLTIVDSSATWANDAAPADNSYVVIQPADPWGDASRWQLLIAARNTSGASTVGGVVGGEAIAGPGLFAAFARDGGWNSTNKNFGASLSTGLINVKGPSASNTNLAASGLHLAVCDRMVAGARSGCSFLLALDDGLTASWNGTVAAGHAFWVNPDYAKPHQFFVGVPVLDNNANRWACIASARAGRAVNAAGTSHNECCTGMMQAAYVSGSLLERDTSGWVPIPLLFRDYTLARTLGWFNGVWQADTGLADKAEDDDQNFIVVGDTFFPSSPTP